MLSKTNLGGLGLAVVGIGLILNDHMFSAIVLLFTGLGIWMADFRWARRADGTGRLVAKGSPGLLMVALMLGAAQAYVITADALLPAVAAQVTSCPTERGLAHVILARALEALH